ETSADILGNHLAGFFHCQAGCCVAPHVRAEVIAAEHNTLSWELPRHSDLVDKLHKIRRSLAGVTAKLIDLVGGRLDQQQASIARGLQHSRFQDEAVCGTDGIDAQALAAPIGGKKLAKFYSRAPVRFPVRPAHGVALPISSKEDRHLSFSFGYFLLLSFRFFVNIPPAPEKESVARRIGVQQ